MASPYALKKPVDAQREYRRGARGALIQNMNMASPYAGQTAAAGIGRRDHAEMRNAGAMPWQIELMKLEEDQRQGNAQRQASKRQGYSPDYNDYQAQFISNPAQFTNPDGSLISFSEYSRGVNNGKSPAVVQSTREYIGAVNAQRVGEGKPELTQAETGRLYQEILPMMIGGETKFTNQGVDLFRSRSGKVTNPQVDQAQGVPWYLQGPGQKLPTQPVAPQQGVIPQQIPQQGAAPPVVNTGAPAPSASPSGQAFGIPAPPQSFQDSVEANIATKARAEGSKKTAVGQADLDNEFRSNATELVGVLQRQVADARALRKLISTNPDFRNTGPWEQYVTKWGDKETAKINSAGIMATLMNLQITKLTPVTENEIDMVSKLWSSVANDPEANIGALQAAEERLMGALKDLDKKREFWHSNGESLKGYRLIGNESWVDNIPESTFNTITDTDDIDPGKYILEE